MSAIQWVLLAARTCAGLIMVGTLLVSLSTYKDVLSHLFEGNELNSTLPTLALVLVAFMSGNIVRRLEVDRESLPVYAAPHLVVHVLCIALFLLPLAYAVYKIFGLSGGLAGTQFAAGISNLLGTAMIWGIVVVFPVWESYTLSACRDAARAA